MYYLPPLLATVAYGVLTAIVLRDVRTRIRALFAVYLTISLLYALLTFITLSGFFPHQTRFWSSFLILAGIPSLIAYYHFIRAFTHNSLNSIAVKLGYASVLFILAPLSLLGHIPQSAYLVDGGLVIDYGPYMYLINIIGLTFVILSIRALVKRLKTLKDIQERTRVAYLLAGVSLYLVFSLREGIPPLPRFPFSQIGHFLNALLIFYVIMRYQLLNIRLIIRRGLLYSGITVTITALYLFILSLLQSYFRNWNTNIAGLGIIIASTILMALMFNPLKTWLQRIIDRLFYGNTYEYRRSLSTFNERMGNILELEELAEPMLQQITRAVHAGQASLLIRDGECFTTQYAVRLKDNEPVIPIKLRSNGLLANWLTRENKPLSREQIDISYNFKGLWEIDKSNLDASEIEIMFPLISKGNLIGILALSKKVPIGFYSSDDIELITTLSREAAVVIENAQLYAEAKLRANIDELTGLFNHRYFHQRLDEEIARASRFGDIFSVINLDLDLFKPYNDIYGHMEGDQILKDVGRKIKQSVRSIDISFRYGGDEFAVILPHTSLDIAKKVSEKIQRQIDFRTDSRGIPLTCSIGISSWPTDGIMREEIIEAADGALYYAKQTGRNRVCLASDVVLSEALTMQYSSGKNNQSILSTIYALAATVDAKDHYTYGHSKKVSAYATEIAQALGFSEDRIATLRTAGLLHDIGKIGISDQILRKTTPLSSDDWLPIRAHPDLGVSILKNVEPLHDCLAAIKYHHERYDGKGYPDSLKGDNIPLDARILSVADAFDAMTSDRPYRKRLSTEAALEELKRHAGTQFDPHIVDTFITICGSFTEEAGTRENIPVAARHR